MRSIYLPRDFALSGSDHPGMVASSTTDAPGDQTRAVAAPAIGGVFAADASFIFNAMSLSSSKD